MRRAATILLLCAAAVIAKPPQSVAVYMAGEEPAAVRGSYKVLGAELAKALAKNKKYAAVDRTDEAVKILSAADIFNNSGSVDVDKARAVGKQLAAQVVCIAEISEVMKSYHLEARLVNVETAEISKVVTRRADIADADDIARTAQSVARELVDGKKPLVKFSFREIKANPDKAIAEYSKAIRKDPNAAVNYNNTGYAYFLKGDYDNAVANFNKSIRLDPNDYITYLNRAQTYYLKGDYDKAIADYSQVIILNKNNDAKKATVYNNRATAYVQVGEYEKAIEGYDQALRLNPNDKVAYSSRTNVYSYSAVEYAKNGDYDKAIVGFNQAIKLSPNYARLYMNRGAAYNLRAINYSYKGDYDKSLADFDKAIADIDKAISLSPDSADAYLLERATTHKNRNNTYNERANTANK
jgi:tetratricopeptide (TPR) repeat protein